MQGMQVLRELRFHMLLGVAGGQVSQHITTREKPSWH